MAECRKIRSLVFWLKILTDKCIMQSNPYILHANQTKRSITTQEYFSGVILTFLHLVTEQSNVYSGTVLEECPGN